MQLLEKEGEDSQLVQHLLVEEEEDQLVQLVGTLLVLELGQLENVVALQFHQLLLLVVLLLGEVQLMQLLFWLGELLLFHCLLTSAELFLSLGDGVEVEVAGDGDPMADQAGNPAANQLFHPSLKS